MTIILVVRSRPRISLHVYMGSSEAIFGAWCCGCACKALVTLAYMYTSDKINNGYGAGQRKAEERRYCRALCLG